VLIFMVPPLWLGIKIRPQYFLAVRCEKYTCCAAMTGQLRYQKQACVRSPRLSSSPLSSLLVVAMIWFIKNLFLVCVLSNLGINQMQQFSGATNQLYRHCLRLVSHVGGNSAKGKQLRKLVRIEFIKNKDESDESKIKALKNNAVRALTNYLMMESSMKDQRLRDKANVYKSAALDSLKKGDDDPVNSTLMK
jgi:hypothetical protein